MRFTTTLMTPPRFVKILIKILSVLCFAFALSNNSLLAQEKPLTAPTAAKTLRIDQAADQTDNAAAAVRRAGDETRRYRIGAGDELEIQVFRHPELSQTVRVNEFGIILLPRVEQPITAACKTENELSFEIGENYKRYLRQPFVRVFVKEFKSQPVAVIGAVDKPGQFNVNRKIRLLEALAVAGGPTDKAGAKVSLARLGRASACEQSNVDQEEPDLSKLLFSYELKKTLEGSEAANPWMQPGDIVTVLDADKAFVVGNVKEPKAILLKERRTLTQALAEAEGILPSTKKNSIFLIRADAAGNQVKTPIDLTAINKNKAADPVLQPNDIIEVPLDGLKETRKNIIKALSGGLSNLPFLIF